MYRMLMLACAGLFVTASAGATTFDATGDRWMYPFNGAAGAEPTASVFGAPGDAMFDDRDGQYLLDFDTYFADEIAELEELERAGLVKLEGNWISVTPKGRMLIRSVCMVFDKYLRQDRDSRRYSRTI